MISVIYYNFPSLEVFFRIIKIYTYVICYLEVLCALFVVFLGLSRLSLTVSTTPFLIISMSPGLITVVGWIGLTMNAL